MVRVGTKNELFFGLQALINAFFDRQIDGSIFLQPFRVVVQRRHGSSKTLINSSWRLCSDSAGKLPMNSMFDLGSFTSTFAVRWSIFSVDLTKWPLATHVWKNQSILVTHILSSPHYGFACGYHGVCVLLCASNTPKTIIRECTVLSGLVV